MEDVYNQAEKVLLVQYLTQHQPLFIATKAYNTSLEIWCLFVNIAYNCLLGFYGNLIINFDWSKLINISYNCCVSIGSVCDEKRKFYTL